MYLMVNGFMFQTLAESEEAQICVLRNLFSLWQNHQQMICVLIDKMLKLQIVECSAVANWIFSREMQTEFTKYVSFILFLFYCVFARYIHFVLFLCIFLFLLTECTYGKFFI